MPKHASVDCLSDSDTDSGLEDDHDDDTDQETASPVGHQKRKRKGGESTEKDAVDKTSEMYLRSLIGRHCKCKKQRRTCLQQFAAPDLFQKLSEYRRHWFELEKLDQDNFVSCFKDFSGHVCFLLQRLLIASIVSCFEQS